MSSFTDHILQFNPYVSQVPVEDFVKVGMYKQEQYNQGVEKVQGYIDNISGLDVAKDVHKDYLNHTLEQLQQSIGKVVTSDFSNSQLVSQIGSLTSRMKKDPIIQNAVISTENYRKGVAEMQKARVEGKNGVENDFDFQSQAQSWLTDNNPNSSFSSTYTPYRDVRKKVMDIIKEVGVDTKLTDIPFLRNADGTVQLDASGSPQLDTVMLETTTEGKSAEKIKRAIQLGLDESDINQLNIEARYHFRGQDAAGMKDIVDKNYSSRLEQHNKILADLQVKKMTNIKDLNFQNSINEQIKDYESANNDLVKDYKKDMESLNLNPTAFKGQFYTRNYLEQVGNTFSTSKASFKIVDNPYQKQVNANREFDLKVREFNNKTTLDNAKLALEAERLAIEKFKAEKDATKAAKEEKSASGLLSDPLTGFTPNSKDIPLTTVSDFRTDIANTETYLTNAKADILNKAFSDGALATLSPYDKEVKLLELKDAYDKGERNSVPPIVSEYFATTDRLNLDLKNKQTALLQLEAKAPQLSSLTSGVTGMTIKDNNATHVYSPTELAEFNKKFNTIIPERLPNVGDIPTFSIPKLNEKLASQIFTTPKEKYLYETRKKNFNGDKQSEADKMIIGKLNTIRDVVNNKQGTFLNQREDFLNKGVRTILRPYQPERYGIDAGNAQKMYRVRSEVDRILDNAKDNKESVGASPHFDYDEAKKLNDDKANSTYAIYKQGDKAFITITGSAAKTNYLPVDMSYLNDVFDNAFVRPFDPIEQTLALTGGRTTNVQGKGAQTAYFTRESFPNVHSYGVKADLQKGTAGYQLELHAYNPLTKQWVSRPVFYGSEEQVIKKMSEVGDRTIEDFLGITPPETK